MKGDYPGTAESHLVHNLHFHEKLFLVLLFGWAACGPIACAGTPKKTTGLEVLSMCGGYYTGKALASEKASIATDEVDRFLDTCRTAATNEVCVHYACLLTQSTEAKIQRDLDASEAPDKTMFQRAPRQLSPLELTFLGRLHPDDWPRFLPRPAWVQWVQRRKAS
jgi:hypothetical protein